MYFGYRLYTNFKKFFIFSSKGKMETENYFDACGYIVS